MEQNDFPTGVNLIHPFPSISTIIGLSAVPLLLALGMLAGWWDIPEYLPLCVYFVSPLIYSAVSEVVRRIPHSTSGDKPH